MDKPVGEQAVRKFSRSSFRLCEMMRVGDAQRIARIHAYYDETWLDYRFLWLNPKNLAIHFGYWDDATHSHSQSLIRMNQVLANRAELSPGTRVLDAGCGVGGTALWLAEEYRAQVVGINLVPRQIALAQKYVRQRNLDNWVRIEQQDYCHTSLPDASFDVVWASESICHAEDKCAFLAEAYRVLKPGGRLVMLEYVRFGRPYAERDERLLHSWLSGWAIPDLATRGEWVRWSMEAGLQQVRLENIEAHVFPSHRRLYRFAMFFYPGEWLLRKIHLRTDVQHGNTRGARDQYRALKRDLWFEGILSALKPKGE